MAILGVLVMLVVGSIQYKKISGRTRKAAGSDDANILEKLPVLRKH